MNKISVSSLFARLSCRALTTGFIALASGGLTAAAMTFTNDTTISLRDTNYEGADIVVTNCTLTVDGPHVFSSIQVAAGGVLTHSFSPNGSISNVFSVVNESQLLIGTNPVTLLNSNVVITSVLVTDSGSTVVYANGLDYLLTSPDGILIQLQRTTNSTIPDGTNVLVNYSVLLDVVSAGLNLTVAGNAEVAAGGFINANGRGYSGGAGPGAGVSAGNPLAGSGAGYGGNGGMSSSNALGGAAYGSFTQPTDLGSGGGTSYAGSGGAGGGAIHLNVGETLLVNGAISADGANGTNSRSGGGSGGSIWLTAHLVAGAGTISAQGGAGEPTHGGGGGGGRIAVQCEVHTLSGSRMAFGGVGAKTGGAGTVFTGLTGQNGLLVLDNGGRTGTNSPVGISSNTIDVLIRGNAKVVPIDTWNIANLTIASNGLLLVSTPQSSLNLNAAGNVTILAGGSLLTDNAGYAASSGPGYGHSSSPDGSCGGGGHGGYGASGSSYLAYGGVAYGSQSSPTTYGSGGGSYPIYSFGGAGGGAIQLNVTGMLQVDGRISANGGNGSGTGGGGGAGGSIWLTVNSLSGIGFITANGGSGAGSAGGGGGGGRISISCNNNLFAGPVYTYGGSGTYWGGAGTVLIQATGQNGQLILDNGGHPGTNTPVQSASSTDLIVRNGASGSGSASFANLLVNSNGWLAVDPSSSTVSFSLSGDATIQAGGGINTDGTGNSGNGRGYDSTSGGSGGGHGGYGGANASGSGGGNTYDSITSFYWPGSPGGNGSGSGGIAPYGGKGGGAVHLTVSGTLVLNGRISANGNDGDANSGGGSGGSISLTVGALTGTGTVSANGGNGKGLGGGGGGGRIAIIYNNNTFTGTITAYGGGGTNSGGAGTVYLQPATPNAQLILDNGGRSGTNTPLTTVILTDLIVRNGAIAAASPSTSFANLLVSSNGWLVPAGSSAFMYWSFSGNATIQAGGGIVTDAKGNAAGTGNGPGQSYSSYPLYPCGGAGHGGYGANGTGNYGSGGITYDSTTSPSTVGSGGGFYSTYSVGGAGGGVIQLSVSGLLQVDGRISANGGNGSGMGGGGGSGGSISLTVGALSGAGSITANGGGGANSIGGGGGGGRIAIIYNNNTFAGLVSAYGGGGANWGGAGTVYLKANSQSYGQLILDNGGNVGTNSSFSASSADLLLAGGARAQWSSGASVRNLQIRTNSVLTTVASTSSQTVNVTGNATIDVGGTVSCDGAGSGAAAGPGAGSSSGSHLGGGGHGGFGAANPPGYGNAYGSIGLPITAGSGGGNAISGGTGGGALRLTVTGGLTVNGRVSANGRDGNANSGGGSGGSLWITADTINGSGIISANGGAGNGSAGGGAGGRIALGYNTDSFLGTVSASGGGGYIAGGAGTIYSKANSQPVGQLLVDNNGQFGTNTPISSVYGTPPMPFNLTVGNGAVVCPPTSFPVFSNLTVIAGGLITGLSSLSNLDLLAIGNVDIAPGGSINVDAEGLPQSSGPGAGQSVSGYGSGAGYGSLGGASVTASGGTNYGSAQQPTDLGSGGGFGTGPIYAGSQGGGAIRLNVRGVLTVDGQFSANGNWGVQDNSGGGSGGSIWVTAGTVAGNGQITADGGDGELFGGGGGAGGRIAIYSRANVFAGLATVSGGLGDFAGGDGTIFYSTNLSLAVLSHAPVGIVSNGVSFVDVVFNEAPDPASFSGTDVSVTTPNGPLDPGTFTVFGLNPSSYRVSFQQQTAVGGYTFTAGTNINDLYGQPMSQVYTGTFTVLLPVIQGTVTDTNGRPVPGILIQPDGGLSSTTTDTNGTYALGILPGWSGTVVPSGNGLMFVPGSRVYTNLSDSVPDQNYLAVTTIAPTTSGGIQGTNLEISWQGISGVTYQVFSSTNLVDWLPYGAAIQGTNGPMEFPVPMTGDPARFFRVQASN